MTLKPVAKQIQLPRFDFNVHRHNKRKTWSDAIGQSAINSIVCCGWFTYTVVLTVIKSLIFKNVPSHVLLLYQVLFKSFYQRNATSRLVL